MEKNNLKYKIGKILSLKFRDMNWKQRYWFFMLMIVVTIILMSTTAPFLQAEPEPVLIIEPTLLEEIVEYVFIIEIVLFFSCSHLVAYCIGRDKGMNKNDN